MKFCATCLAVVLLELVSESVEKRVASSSRKKSVILPSKVKKKHFSIFDEIPEELLEKRRSCRNILSNQPTSLATSTDTSCDVGASKGVSTVQRDLLTSFFPPSLLLAAEAASSKSSTASLPPPDTNTVKKSIITNTSTPWLVGEEVAKKVTEFLESNVGGPVDLMRNFSLIWFILKSLACPGLEAWLERFTRPGEGTGDMN